MPLDEILEQINEKYKGQFTDADKVIIDALHQKLKKNAVCIFNYGTTDNYGGAAMRRLSYYHMLKGFPKRVQ